MLNCQSATRLVSEAQERRLSVPEKMVLIHFQSWAISGRVHVEI